MKLPSWRGASACRSEVGLGFGGVRVATAVAARFADRVDILCPEDRIAHKVAVLAKRCEEIGREAHTLTTSFLVSAVPVESHADVHQVRAGLTPYMREFALVGTPEQMAEHVAEKVLPQGVGGLIVNMPCSGHVPGTVEAVGQALAPLVHGSGRPMTTRGLAAVGLSQAGRSDMKGLLHPGRPPQEDRST